MSAGVEVGCWHKSLQEVWFYRRFIVGSVMREFKSRYARTVLGATWLLLAPFAMILVYTLVFSKMMRSGIPGDSGVFSYSIYLCAGLLTWQWFAELLTRTTTVLVDQASLIRKNQLPVICLYLIAILSTAVGFLISFLLFMFFLLVIGQFPGWSILALPLLLLLQVGFASALGGVLSVLNVFFRDVGQALAICLQFWFWFTPIVYPIEAIPTRFQSWLMLNPVLPLTDSYHKIFVTKQWPAFDSLIGLAVVTLALLALAVMLSVRTRGQLLDEI